MEYISTREAAAKWGISANRITILANEGRIPGAQRLGINWLIPADAEKPPKRKANQPHPATEVEADSFSFPLYHFRPDWSPAKEQQLTEQQKSLLQAETAVLECRFADSYSLLNPILSAPDDIYTEVGALWCAGICCIGLNKPEVFPGIYLRMQMRLSGDFPHRNDLAPILDILNTYKDSIGTIANTAVYNTDVHRQALPLTSLLSGYAHLSREAMRPGSTDAALLELILRFLQSTGSAIATEMMHCYLLGIYFFRKNGTAAEKHAKAAVQMAFESKLCFPLVTFYCYFAPVLDPVLAQYPEEFQAHCHELISQYEENFAAFASTLSENSVISKFADSDYPLVCAVLTNAYNNRIAKSLGITQQTVKHRLDKLCEKLGVANKKELRDYLHKYM